MQNEDGARELREFVDQLEEQSNKRRHSVGRSGATGRQDEQSGPAAALAETDPLLSARKYLDEPFSVFPIIGVTRERRDQERLFNGSLRSARTRGLRRAGGKGGAGHWHRGWHPPAGAGG